MKKIFLTLVFLLIAFVSCKSKQIYVAENIAMKLNTNENLVEFKQNLLPETADSTFVNLKNYSNDFVYDMKYATNDNFLKTKVYDCATCFLRLKTVKALILANQEFLKMGYKIKLYDCYRPLDVQKQMWAIVPNPNYVANPNKGSIHNKGCAIDISLVDNLGNELDMGTKFDHFGIEASHNFLKLNENTIQNRMLLKKIMKNANFNSFESEWWHYNLAKGLQDKVSNKKWTCD